MPIFLNRIPKDMPDNMLARIKDDYEYHTFFSVCVSLVITIVFALANCVLGVIHASSWHFSIFIYYTLLATARGIIPFTEKHGSTRSGKTTLQTKAFFAISLIFLFINISIIGPIMIMIRQEKEVYVTMVPAIAMAAYTFYKVTLAVIWLIKIRKSKNALLRSARTINIIDALFSIIVLQSTLIAVSGSENDHELIRFSAVTSGLIWSAMVVLSAGNTIYGLKGILKKDIEPEASDEPH